MTPVTPRLFAAPEPTLEAHRGQFGPVPEVPRAELISLLESAGLTGRGGAGFPTARKLATVRGPKPIVVGNGAEGEPLSRKDAELLRRSPHLVLDGLAVVASAIAADKVYLYLHRDAVPAVQAALEERQAAALDSRGVLVVGAPDRFVAGEESAAVRAIEGGPPIPRDRTVVAAVSGVRGRPTLVNNVETLAHIALIARFGAEWFGSAGDPQEPGTMLVTLSGSLQNRGVFEVPTGTLLTDLIGTIGGTDPASLRAILVGGFHGSWIPAEQFADSRLSRSGLAALGATPGAGVVHALGMAECGIVRTAEIARYLADQSARQCGPCLNGLPLIADMMDEVAVGPAGDSTVREIRRISRLVDGRGACRHLDGTSRMIRSALRAFAVDIELHNQRRCIATGDGGPVSRRRGAVGEQAADTA